MMRRNLGILAFVAVSLFTLVGVADSASFSYSDQSRQIKAGVVVLRSSPAPNSISNPYAFHVMNQRRDLKPKGWEFYNPLAPTHVTPGIMTRWGTAYTEGMTVRNNMGCYWEILLDTADSNEIAQYDVLLIPGMGLLEFTVNEREKLRKFVDSGGVLWIENRGGATFNTSARRFFIPQLQFPVGTVPPNISVPPMAAAHSVLNRPFLLSYLDIQRVGMTAVTGMRYVSNATQNGPPDPRYFTSVILAANQPMLSVAQYGSGHIVAVGQGVGQAITQRVGVTAGYCGTAFMLADTEDLKLAYNIVSLGSHHTTYQRTPRRTGSSFDEVGAPLVTLWEYRVPGAGAGATASSPAILDDMVFYADGAGVLHAFELYPWKDRDMDGNPDDGQADLPGAPYDELWSAPLGSRASAPTAAYMPLAGGVSVPVVFVTLASGDVLAFNALSGASNAVYSDSVAGFSPDFTGRLEPPAPAYSDGLLFVGDGAGYLHARDYFTDTEWVHPRVPTVMGPCHSPAVGYYYDSASGATEQVVYVAKRGVAGTPPATGEIWSYPIKVFNETLNAVNAKDQPGLFATRSTNTPLMSDDTTWNVYFTRPGQGIQDVPKSNVTVNPPGQPGRIKIDQSYFENTITTSGTVYADYQLDYNHPVAQPRKRISVHQPPVPTGTGRSGIAGTPATSRKDILYFAAENGSLYAVKDSVRGAEPLIYKWRWHMGDPGAMQALGMTDPVPIGSPAVSGDMVYFAVNDGGGGFILAFKADPVFSVNLGSAVKAGTSVRVKQWDSMDTAATLPFDFGGGTSEEQATDKSTWVVDYDSGRVTFQNFRSGSRYLSAAQPLLLEYIPEGGETYVPMEIQPFQPAIGDKWNNLVWFMRLDRAITASPILMGDILYLGCHGGVLASVDVAGIGRLRKGPAEPVDAAWAENNDLLYAEPLMGTSMPLWAAPSGSHGVMAAATAAGIVVLHDPVTLIADGDRLVEMDAGGRVVWSCDSTIALARTATGMPGGTGAPVFGAVKVPFNRPALARHAVVGGIMVADTGNNRVVHIDSGGSLLWEISSFLDPGFVLPSGSPLSLNRPRDVSMWVVQPDATAYPEYHYLIADPGNHRVVEIVARYDADTNSYRNELVWSSKTLEQGGRYEYTSVRPIADSLTPGADLICVVANQVTDGGVSYPGGALLRISDVGGDEQYTVIRGLPIEEPDPPRRIAKPSFYTRHYSSTTTYTDVVIEPNAIHVVQYQDPGGGGAPVPTLLPAFTANDYRARTDLPLSATHAQVLANGNILVTNRATQGSGPFKGCVFELHWDGAQWVIVGEQIGIETPGSNSHGLRQPSSAERQLF